MLGTQRYCKFFLLSVICFFISFSSLYAASGFDLSQYLSKATQGEDPEQPDTIYLVCLTQTQNPAQQIVEVRLKTDNVAPGDSIAGILIPLIIETDKPGVVLDTTISTTYSGTALGNWDSKSVSVISNGGDPSQFPLTLLMGGADFGGPPPPVILGKGDYLIANLVFKVSDPTLICLDTTTWEARSLAVATTAAVAYTPQWRSCCSDIPTLTQWGLIILGLLLLAYVTYFIYSKRKPYTPTRSFGG